MTGSLARVSVVIPCYNSARWIRETLASVLQQGEDPIEIIAIDDGSTDDTAAIIERDFPAVRLVRTANRGASRARNHGTELASGEFIQYLDADDLLMPGKLGIQLKAMEQTGADAAYGDWQKLVLDENGGFVEGEITAKQMGRLAEIALFTDFWCPPATYLFRRSIVEKVGGWNESLPVIQDARFALDCALHGGKFTYCSGVMAYYRVHSAESLSRRDSVAFVRDIFRNACEVEEWWRANGGLGAARTKALTECYGYVARSTYERDPEIFETAYTALMRLAPRYIPKGPPHLALAARFLGYRRAEAVALFYRRAKRSLPTR